MAKFITSTPIVEIMTPRIKNKVALYFAPPVMRLRIQRLKVAIAIAVREMLVGLGMQTRIRGKVMNDNRDAAQI